MKRLTTPIFLLAFLLFAGNWTYAQTGKPDRDERARELVRLGRQYYQNKKFLDAAITFDLATQRPYNQLTTYSWYMAGVSYYQLGEPVKSLASLDKLLKEYPGTKYAEEARYHQGLNLLVSEKRNDQERGLDRLFRIMRETQDGSLRTDTETAIRDFMFNHAEHSFLDLYKVFIDAEYMHWIVEAICFKADQRMEGYQVLKEIEKYEASGKPLSPYLEQLKGKYTGGHIIDPGRLNVAIFLSFNLQLTDTATVVPKRSRRALELFEGMKMAADSLEKRYQKQVNIRVFDTQGDTALLRTQLDSLDGFQPDVIVGDIRTTLVEMISQWAENHQVLHLVPRNPFSRVVQNKRYTFLLHPALETHGAQMGLQMYHLQGKRKFLVFNDHTFVPERFTNAFKAALDTLPGASVTIKDVDKQYEANRKSIPQYVKSLKNSGYDAIYIPLSSEEAAGLIISQLNYHKIEIPVIGGPDWELFNVIDPELKSQYDLQYSTFYFDQNDSIMYDSMFTCCLRDYGYQPSKYTVQGYDIMSYLLESFRQPSAYNDLGEMIRQAPVYHGIHQDFHFGGRQINQKINIIKFQDGRITKVNWDRTQPDPFPDGE